MSKSTSNIVDFAHSSTVRAELTEMLRQGARELIHQAVQVELTEFLAAFNARRLDDGRQAVVRNGFHPEREIQTGIGPGASHERCPLFMPRVLNPLGYCSALLAGLTKPRQSDPSYGLIGFSTDPVLQA